LGFSKKIWQVQASGSNAVNSQAMKLNRTNSLFVGYAWWRSHLTAGLASLTSTCR